ncbi:hypothetical protein GE09DRAFT_1195792 [Coniochaeta sp. 2T2.1]|nr:hypothetical protein GE09DRAFT_1195792 [Coniochaeta sp. 2T2.1]
MLHARTANKQRKGAICGAWEQFSRKLNEFQAAQAAERVQGLSTASYRFTSSSTVALPQTTGRLSGSSVSRTLPSDAFTSPSRTRRYTVESPDTPNSGEKETRFAVRGSDSDPDSLNSIEQYDRVIEEAEDMAEYNDGEEKISSADSDSDSDSDEKSLDSLEELERIIEEAEAAAEPDDDFQPDCSSDISDGSDSNLSTGRKRRRWSESSPGSARKRVRSFY